MAAPGATATGTGSTDGARDRRAGRRRALSRRAPVLPRYTVRLRLTLLYGGLFLASAAALLGISYLLVRQSGSGVLYSVKSNGRRLTVVGPHGPVGAFAFRAFRYAPAGGGRAVRLLPGGLVVPAGQSDHAAAVVPAVRLPAGSSAPGSDYQRAGKLPSGASAGAAVPALAPPPLAFANTSVLTVAQVRAQAHKLQALARQQHGDELHRLLVDLAIALAIMTIVSMGLGWFVAGRVLAPLHTITRAAHAISATNLHRRLSLRGPRDELRELGDTIDGLLERLERAFDAQRQFVANASHELRTPLTLERAILEVTLADPAAGSPELRAACERALAIGEEQERTIDALLTLARSERGLERREPLQLDELLGTALAAGSQEIADRGLRLTSRLASAPLTGDRRLVERLIANLLDNAVRHNTAGGSLEVCAGPGPGGEAVLSVANSGPVVAPDAIGRLFEPFTRLGAERGNGQGQGLGLSIVRAIAEAHGARLAAHPRAGGGLAVEVSFAPAPAALSAAPARQPAPA